MKSSYKKQIAAPLALSLALSACSSSTQTSQPETASSSPNAPTTQPTATPQPESEAPANDAISGRVIEEVVVTAHRSDARWRATRETTAVPNMASKAQVQYPSQPIYAPPSVRPPHYLPPYSDADGENYPEAAENPVKRVADDPVSTFSIDVDTAAYANARRQLNAGQMPVPESVRVEEFINYFNYSYPTPQTQDTPFSVTTEVGPSPWNADRKLLLVGLQGYDVNRDNLPPANLVFLIDVSGSMNQPQKLGLLKSSMKMLAKQLRAQDTLSIVVYAGAAGEVLAPTKGTDRQAINDAIDALHAGGSTNGGAGIHLAYKLALKNKKDDGINRVILATDGDFNVGPSSTEDLRKLIERKRKTGVSLSVLGFGTGNYNDALMQELAQTGNGNAAYIDSINEARKVLVDEMGSTLKTIAKDVKIQLEFNPAAVQEYRLIGYETRALKREDFNNDRIDAGEIGAGHSVTALYELTMATAKAPAIDKLRYGALFNSEETGSSRGNANAEIAHLKLRYKAPEASTSKRLERIVYRRDTRDDLSSSSNNFKFAAAASAFGQLLKNSSYTGEFGYADALALAKSARGADEFGYRGEFEQLIRTARELTPEADIATAPENRQRPDDERVTMR